ncbi:MAG: MmcQ/YjbR family DNA-binding protein [Myxococcaceae bacterium]|nr:MmcQ/YjbR family DNA-binding protein [Myxococcaceae bacterium]MCI0673297.1 MmcQ/YjbR family DNA-binding protein [Myxococcaceae bacterium]
MVHVDDVRALALSMPEAEEKAHFGHPDFRVRNKIFAALRPEDGRAVFKLGREEMLWLVDHDPAAYSAAPGFERGGWTRVELSRVDASQLRRLVVAAWKTIAPKRLVAAYARAPNAWPVSG